MDDTTERELRGRIANLEKAIKALISSQSMLIHNIAAEQGVELDKVDPEDSEPVNQTYDITKIYDSVVDADDAVGNFQWGTRASRDQDG